jgi:hypothetical protein
LDGSAAGGAKLEMRTYCCYFFLQSSGFLNFEAKKKELIKQWWPHVLVWISKQKVKKHKIIKQ